MAIYLNFGGFLFASLAKTIWFGGGGSSATYCDLRQNPRNSRSLSFHFCTRRWSNPLKAVLRQVIAMASNRVGSRQK